MRIMTEVDAMEYLMESAAALFQGFEEGYTRHPPGGFFLFLFDIPARCCAVVDRSCKL